MLHIPTHMPQIRAAGRRLDQMAADLPSACKGCATLLDQAVQHVEKQECEAARTVLERLRGCMDTCILMRVNHASTAGPEPH